MVESKFIRKQQSFYVDSFGYDKHHKRHMLGRNLVCTSVSDLKNTIDVLTKQPFYEGIKEIRIIFLDEIDEGDEDDWFDDGGMPEGEPIKSDIMPEY